MPVKFGFKPSPKKAPPPEPQVTVEAYRAPPTPDKRPDPMGPLSKEFLASSKPTSASLKAAIEEWIAAINRLAHFNGVDANLKLGRTLFRQVPELVKEGKIKEAQDLVRKFWEAYKKVMAKGKLQRPDFYD